MRPKGFNATLRASLALALVALFILAGCSSKDSPEEPVFPGVGRGSTLSVTVFEMQIKDAVYYQEADSTYIVTPSEPGRKLAAALVAVRNDKATSLFMDVKEGSFSLLDKEGKVYPGINPFKSRQLAPNVPQAEQLFTFIWGNRGGEIPLGSGLIAWTLFDVPSDIIPSQFRWDEVETVPVNFFP